MHDDVHRPCNRNIAQDLVLSDIPIFRNIGEIGVADDDQQIIVRLIAVLRLVDPVTARIAAEQDDILDLAVLFPRLRRARGRDGKSSINIRVARASSSCCASGR